VSCVCYSGRATSSDLRARGSDKVLDMTWKMRVGSCYTHCRVVTKFLLHTCRTCHHIFQGLCEFRGSHPPPPPALHSMSGSTTSFWRCWAQWERLCCRGPVFYEVRQARTEAPSKYTWYRVHCSVLQCVAVHCSAFQCVVQRHPSRVYFRIQYSHADRPSVRRACLCAQIFNQIDCYCFCERWESDKSAHPVTFTFLIRLLPFALSTVRVCDASL